MKGVSPLVQTEILMDQLSAQSCSNCLKNIAFCELAGMLSRGQLPSKDQIAGNPCSNFICENLCPARIKANEVGIKDTSNSCPVETQLIRTTDALSFANRAIQGAIIKAQPDFCQRF